MRAAIDLIVREIISYKRRNRLEKPTNVSMITYYERNVSTDLDREGDLINIMKEKTKRAALNNNIKFDYRGAIHLLRTHDASRVRRRKK